YGRAPARVAAGGRPGREAHMAGFPYSLMIAPAVLILFRALSRGTRDEPESFGRLRRDVLARYAPSADPLRCTRQDLCPDGKPLTVVVYEDVSSSLLLLSDGNTIAYDVGADLGPTKRFVEAVVRLQGRMKETNQYPGPPYGNVRFWSVRPNVTLTSGDVW